MSTEALQREHFDTALGHLRTGNPIGAASACDDALKEFPGDANLLCLAAKANIVLQRFDGAKLRLEEAIRLHPDFAVAHDVYGDLMLSQGHADSAIKAYEQAMRLDPTRPAIVTKIDKAQQLLAEAPEMAAQPVSQPAASRRMAFEDEMRNAEQLKVSGKAQEAESIYRSILKRDPNHVEASRLLAGIAIENNKPNDAEVFLRHAAANAPDYGRLWVDLTNVLRDAGKLDQALESAKKMLELAPEKAESHMLHASVLGAANRHDAAIEAYEKALQFDPARAGAMCSLAHHLKTVGRQDEGIAMYRKCIATKADHAEAYWSLANLKTFRFEDDELIAMQVLLDDDNLSDESRVQIHNALGLDCEARKKYDSAFGHFEQCNILRRKSETYDPVETETGYDRIIEIFTEEFLGKNENFGDRDASPIFIVGLPRSGSTLIEQILASHSMVDGTHELGELPRVAQRIRRLSKSNARFPDNLLELSTRDWKTIGSDYIADTRKFRSGAPRFIDKNPNNFIFTGLLRLALPNAKIINARRHPLDSCFGTYKQLFASGQPFSYDFTELGEYYLQYQRLMDHWHRLMPGFVLDVRYEDVVADLDNQVRRILEFCELPFEENCLRFHETERAVKTASSEQVRQPIYASSVNLWRNYEKHIAELVHIMEPLLQSLPESGRPAGFSAD